MKVAVAIDGSDNALRATEHGLFLVKHLPNASLELIFVVDFNKVKDDYLLTQSSDSLALAREQKVRSALNLIEEAGIKAKITTLRGDPSQKIINYVNSKPIDQLILGSRGLNVLQKMVLGSVSHKVIKRVKCPVTIVK